MLNDEQHHLDSGQNDDAALRLLWDARAIAIVGASDRTGSLGRLPVEYCQRYGYRGAIYPVRPDAAPVAGISSYSSVSQCPLPVDLAVILVAAHRVPDAIADCAAAGVRMAIVCPSGFAESGPTGAQLQDDLAREAQAHGIRLLGPNCIGAAGIQTAQLATFTPLFQRESSVLVPGPLGFVAQSGALGFGAVSLAFERGLGLNWVVTTGNEADVTAPEVMAAMAREPDCRGVLGYLESLTDISALRKIRSSGIPVALVKSGRSPVGAEAAASHTGALATGDRVVDTALRQAGVVRADDIDELLDLGEAMGVPHTPTGNRVAVVTTSGGCGILAADAIEAYGLRLAQLAPDTRNLLTKHVPAYGNTNNPVDVTAAVMSNPNLITSTLDALAADPGVDLVIVCLCVLTGSDVDTIVEAMTRLVQVHRVPALMAKTGADHLAPTARALLRDVGVPVYSTPARAVRAAAALCAWARPISVADHINPAKGATVPKPGMNEVDLKRMLSDAGVPVPQGMWCSDAAALRDAISQWGGACVVKAIVPGMLHKSEHGAVAVGVTATEADSVFARMAGLGGRVWAEQQAPDGVDVFVGVAPSALGPVLTVGLGGVFAELLDDVALRVTPLSRADLEGMIDETRLGRLLAGFRGAPQPDRAALVTLLEQVAAMAVSWPSGFELDLNPVRVFETGCCVLDAAYVAPPSDSAAPPHATGSAASDIPHPSTV